MQTFLPYPNFRQSAEVLDNKRLGKQRVEVLQILNALTDSSYGWQNHPAVKMWRGYELMLAFYGYMVCEVWRERGFKDTCKEKILQIMRERTDKAEYVRQARKVGVPDNTIAEDNMPPFVGNEQFHASHRSNLLRKDPEYYSRFGWKESDDIPYYWPTEHNSNETEI